MSIRKKDLYDFIESKSRDRKKGLEKVVRTAVKAAFQPIIFEMYRDMEPVERKAQQLYDELLAAKDRHTKIDLWRYSSIAQDINSHVIGFRKGVLNNQVSLAIHNILDGGTNGLPEKLRAAADQIELELSSTISEYKDLVKLTDELLTLIDASRNGDKAYKQLQDLGVDLKGFEGVSPNLPAVVKLSVDPCVLNGTCVG